MAGVHRFELTGGALCLDLVNTVDSRPTPGRRDHLAEYDDLAEWARQAGLVEEEGRRRLARAARRSPPAAAEALGRAVRLREALFDLFAAAADGRPSPEGPLQVLNDEIRGSLALRRLAPSDGTYAWERPPQGAALDALLHPVIDSACGLLTSEGLGRVRRCEAESCDWLFLDTSRNRSRRWCDMSVCGNRAKARRHYARVRNESKGPGRPNRPPDGRTPRNNPRRGGV